MLNNIKFVRKLSMRGVLENSNLYTEIFLTYNKKKKYIKECSKTFFIKDINNHICVENTGNTSNSVCPKCKGSGILFNTKSVIDFNYYKLCKKCQGTGYINK